MQSSKDWRIKINRRILIIVAIIFSVFVCSYFSVSLHYILSNNMESLLNIDAISIINTLITEKRVLAVFCILELMVVSFLLLFSNKTKNIYHSDKVKLTDKLEIPTPIGDGQHGTSWWLQKNEYDTIFKCNTINRNREYKESCFDSAGIITNFERKNEIEKIHFIDENLHVLLIGNSGSGKSRSILIPSITMLGLARRESFHKRC